MVSSTVIIDITVKKAIAVSTICYTISIIHGNYILNIQHVSTTMTDIKTATDWGTVDR